MSDGSAAITAPRRAWGIAALCVLTAAGLVVLFLLRNPVALLAELPGAQVRLHAEVARLGIWAPVAFTVGYAVLMVLIWVPSWPWTLLGGFLFGPIAGTIYSMIATTVGAVGVFQLAKSGLSNRLPRGSAIVNILDAGFKRDALEYVIALRVMPVMPFGIVHVAAGMLGVSLRVFTLGTVIGMLPGVVIYSYLGLDLDRIAARGGALDVATLVTPSVVLPLLGIAALALVPVAVRRIRERFARSQPD